MQCIAVQCIGMWLMISKLCNAQWIAYDKHSCAMHCNLLLMISIVLMHWTQFAYDKHS